uniref:Uncharacterized protein n=2 Tax=Salix viminalis TaxID=40686 RepID=A0A6N2NHE4_SALVM
MLNFSRIDSEFQMRYRGEDIRTVPCFIADFGRVVPRTLLKCINFLLKDIEMLYEVTQPGLTSNLPELGWIRTWYLPATAFDAG